MHQLSVELLVWAAIRNQQSKKILVDPGDKNMKLSELNSVQAVLDTMPKSALKAAEAFWSKHPLYPLDHLYTG